MRFWILICSPERWIPNNPDGKKLAGMRARVRQKLGRGLAAIQGPPSTVSDGFFLVLLVQGQPEADLKGRENSLEMNTKRPGDLLYKSHGRICVPGKNGTETPSTASALAKPVTRFIALSSL